MSFPKTKDKNNASKTQDYWQSKTKMSEKPHFIPFVDERDGLGRLLPLDPPKSSEHLLKKDNLSSHPMLKTHKKNFAETDEHRYQYSSASRLTSFRMALQKSLSRNKMNRSRETFFGESDLPSNFEETPLCSPKHPNDSKGGYPKVLYKRMPNYSFSKSIKKTVIDETIEKCRNKNLDFIDVSRAHDLLHRRPSYVPEYSKMARPKNSKDNNRDISHGYLMKILNFQDKENIARGFI
jgi:hypothetical protein